MISCPKKYVTAGSPMHQAVEDMMNDLMARQAVNLSGGGLELRFNFV